MFLEKEIYDKKRSGGLKSSGHKYESIFEEIRENLDSFLKEKDPNFNSFFIDEKEDECEAKFFRQFDEEEKKFQGQTRNLERKKDPSKKFEKIKMVVFVKE